MKIFKYETHAYFLLWRFYGFSFTLPHALHSNVTPWRILVSKDRKKKNPALDVRANHSVVDPDWLSSESTHTVCWQSHQLYVQCRHDSMHRWVYNKALLWEWYQSFWPFSWFQVCTSRKPSTLTTEAVFRLCSPFCSHLECCQHLVSDISLTGNIWHLYPFSHLHFFSLPCSFYLKLHIGMLSRKNSNFVKGFCMYAIFLSGWLSKIV